ncbi:GNAT family N-acetyltransferase [Pseudooceanicola sp. LIPI14-2-Ac024]|uniref:GNAT family N-acetyltransferase n=1 Tax=Pseudooceanicola sp. LIPI14-2-Ac024 TaxID=3344875 RepID=UPI0035D0487E
MRIFHLDRRLHATPVLSRAQADEIVEVITLGFAADPFLRWLYPDPRHYLRHVARVVHAFGGRAFDHHGAHLNATRTAAALWLPPGVKPDQATLIRTFAASVPARKHRTLFRIDRQMQRFHPRTPCWHLAFIATDPCWQGQGQGDALLAETLRLCDADGHPAYLESTNPANLTLYRRHGFREIGRIEVTGAPPIVPMLRD